MPGIKVGAPYVFSPSAFAGEKEDGFIVRPKLTGKITWIHPKGRFFLVEAPCHKHIIRECFYMGKRAGNDEI